MPLGGKRARGATGYAWRCETEIKQGSKDVRHLLVYGLTAGLSFGIAGAVFAQGQTGDRMQGQMGERMQEQMRDQQIYGSEMMTPEERQEYRDRMRNATSAEEREQVRAEHHERMAERAQERGVDLPPAPPGQGPGMAPGGGMGPRGGQGPGGDSGAGRGGR